MIKAFLDESGIHEGAQICVIGGFFGRQNQLTKLEKAWKRVLEKFLFPLADFHAKDLIKQRKRAPMLMALANAISSQRKVYPVSYGIVVEDFKSFSLIQRRFLTGATIDSKSGKMRTSGCPSKPYFVPFQNIVKLITDHAPVDGKAHFSFGSDRPFSEYALTLFKQMRKISRLGSKPWSKWESRNRLGIAQFPLASKTAELQAADLLVHLTYLHMEEWLTNGKVQEPSPLLTLCISNSLSPHHHVYQDRECLEKVLEQTRLINATWDRPATAIG